MATTTTAAPAATTTAAAADTKVAATTAGSATRMMGEYEIGVTLGKGLQGKVKLGTHVKTGEKVALKMIDKAKIKPGSREKKCLEREVSIMEKLSHDNIVTLKKVEWDAVYPKRDGTSQEVILLVLELATGGELFDFMMYTGSFPEGIARAYFQQLMAGLKHCHGHKVAHRDLKPENLLLTSAFGLKVADFGLSALSEDGEGKPVLLRTQCGTRGYMAPEVLARRPYDGYAADVWSCGVILFIMLAGFPPFQLASSSDWWFQRIRNKQYKLFWEAHLRVATISAGAQKLLTKIFNADPKSRATMEEIEADEWYNASAITQATLTAELQRRMKAVQDQKRAEREAEERKRAAAAAAAGGATFDPFAREVHRAVKTAGADSDVPAPPLPASVFPRYTRFYTRERPKDITDRLAQTFSVMSADYKTAAAPYKLKASINTTTGQPVELSAAVFRTDDGLHVVDFLRRQGDLFKFQQVYKAVCEAMKDVICVPPSDDATTATDAAATAATDADATTAATGGGAGGGAGTTSAAAAVMM